MKITYPVCEAYTNAGGLPRERERENEASFLKSMIPRSRGRQNTHLQHKEKDLFSFSETYYCRKNRRVIVRRNNTGLITVVERKSRCVI